jgi:Acyl-CoA dehydrogenases
MTMITNSSSVPGLGVFFVRREAPGVRERAKWDSLGMRATATHGLILDEVFVPADEALALPGAFVKMMQMSRGSFVGNQVAVAAIYLGVAYNVWGSSRVDLQACKLGTGRRFTTS